MGIYVKVYSDELAHHGIKGMKWGVRRWQTKDGGLTAAGRKRYRDDDKLITGRQASKKANVARKSAIKELNDSPEKHTLHQYNKAARKAAKESIAEDKAFNRNLRAERKAAKIAGKEAVKAENAANKQAKAEYKERTTLNDHQKKVRAGATVASTLLLSPVGGVAVAVGTTAYMRSQNDKNRAAGASGKTSAKAENAAREAYKSRTALNSDQKKIRAGATIATSILLTPIGGAAVAVGTTAYMRSQNDENRS